ncbi:unnamed protein product [Symbiodinium sp. CCMP2592]|nr:unnamed protein product [Symbiodinium sp. CCMP2592]
MGWMLELLEWKEWRRKPEPEARVWQLLSDPNPGKMLDRGEERAVKLRLCLEMEMIKMGDVWRPLLQELSYRDQRLAPTLQAKPAQAEVDQLFVTLSCGVERLSMMVVEKVSLETTTRHDQQGHLDQAGHLPGWVTRLGEFFKAPAVQWLPSPIPSPPRPRLLNMNVDEHAGGTSGLPRPSAGPCGREGAIQAEVQRQLGGLLDKLQIMEGENIRLNEQLAQAHRQLQAQPPREAVTVPESVQEPRVDPSSQQGRVFEPPGEPSRGHEGRPDPWRDPLGALWEEFQSRRVAPPQEGRHAQPPQVEAPSADPARESAVEDPTTMAILDALTKNLTSLQELQAKSLQRDDSPEQVKSNVTNLPMLPGPEGTNAGIVFQDWLAQVAVPMQDLSAASGTWWAGVLGLVREAYSKWLAATPLERLQLEPTGHEAWTSARWTRINSRACSLILQSLVEAIRLDLIARRAVQSAPLMLFRLHTCYQPGGANERSAVLGNLQSPTQPTTVDDALTWLRSWPRWVQRCKDLNMMVPDGTILAKALTTVTAKFVAENQDTHFRTQLLRSSLRIDGQPGLMDVVKYHQHLQAEVESMIAARAALPVQTPAIKAMTTSPSSPSASSASPSKPPCKYFLKQGGCRRGQRCPYTHDLNSVSKAERARKCLVCGSEEHRQKDCPTKTPKQGGRPSAGAGFPAHGSASPSSTSPANVPKITSVEPEGEKSPSVSAHVVAGEPVWTLETLLQAAAKVAGAQPPNPKAPSMNVLALKRTEAASDELAMFALVDSGATHALRRASSQEEWEESDPVTVNLAGGESISLRMNAAGTILVPINSMTAASSTLPIVPLGALVSQLGYTMTWGKTKCKLEGKNGEVIVLRVRDGCPEVTEQEALKLISQLEDARLEELRENTKDTRTKVKAAALAMERTWFDYLLSYIDGGLSSQALKAVESAPFLQEVPRECKAGLVDAVPEANGWQALKGLEHLNRKTRKRLWASDKWLVHLYAGKADRREFRHLEGHGYTILELDIERGITHDVLRASTWRALEWGARMGKIGAIVGGPPQSTFMISRHVVGGPEPVRSNEFLFGNWPGQSDSDLFKVNRETQLITRMIYLHALATAGRLRAPHDPTVSKEVAFLLEHPRDPRGYLKFQDPLYPDVVSLWRTSLWSEYAMEAGLQAYSFDMAALGKAFTRHTTEFYEHLVIVLRDWGKIPRMLKMSAEQWRDHVRRGHLPFRADCTVCVQAGGTGRRHSRVEHPSAFVLSADLSGAVKVGGVDPDGRGAFPRQFKYIFAAKLRVPKSFVEDGRGVWLDYDPGEMSKEDYEEKDDGLAPASGGERDPGGEDPREKEGEDIEPELKEVPRRDPEEDSDLGGPELVNLIFACGLKDDKAPTVLEAVQDVILYCRALNIPVLRFHADRGMEFRARATRQWLKGEGIRVTTSEAGVHQTNGAAESTIRWLKQRARALLLSAGLPQRLWPSAISVAASMQRGDVLGFEPKLAAPYGSKVLVRKRHLDGPKLDDLAPRWLSGVYVGLSDSLSKGHLVYVSDGEGERFVHTLHVRAGLHDPGPPEEEVQADLPGPPERRVRGKASGSGDVVAVSKAQVFDEGEFQQRAEVLLQSWNLEAAECLVRDVARLLPEDERVYGMFRHGGRIGVTKSTVERPWFAMLLNKVMQDRASDAEYAAIFVSMNNEREVHIDRNNALGAMNHLLPISMPRRGGELWMELRDGDVVSGKVIELLSGEGRARYGCAFPLQEGRVFSFDPHRRHAVLPWKGERIVIVGYTPALLASVPRLDREMLWALDFPLPLEDDEAPAEVYINALSVSSVRPVAKGIEAEAETIPTSDGEYLFKCDWSIAKRELQASESSTSSQACNVSESDPIPGEDWEDWEMHLVLDNESTATATLSSSDDVRPSIKKAEVTYTDGIEEILDALSSPVSVVYTVNPKEVAAVFEKWIPALQKEVNTLDHAVDKVMGDDPQVREDLSSGRGQLIPMKVVYTIKPPDPPAEEEQPTEFFKRKSRIVICGNMASHCPSEVFASTAPAEVVRAAIALARFFNWNLGAIDIVAAFLQTPLRAVKGAPLVYGVPPKILVRAGLVRPGELWKLTHAVYGLQESPKLWGAYRDDLLAQIQLVFDGKRVTLMQGRVEPSWWSVLQDGSVLIGILVVYVDDLLLCGRTELIKELAAAIKAVWKTSPLQLATEGEIRFLGIEISFTSQGFALTQRAYIEELLRIHEMTSRRRDLVPVAKEAASFVATDDEGPANEGEVRAAQQIAGELLWISQRTRPDIAYVCSLIGSLATRAPRRAVEIGEKTLGYLQRTIGRQLLYESCVPYLTGFVDASFAPDASRSHTGWIVLLAGNVIAWRSSRQSCISLSTAEAELEAAVEGLVALQGIQALLHDIGVVSLQLQMHSDSTSALAIAKGSCSWRTRHLRLKSSWVSELIAKGIVEFNHCSGEVQPADLLTKPLSSARMRALCGLIGLIENQELQAGDGQRELPGDGSRSSQVLVALLVLAQAVSGERVTEEQGVVVYGSGVSVDYGLLTWVLLWLLVLLGVVSWEALKWIAWTVYDRAIQREVAVRLETRPERRAQDARRTPAEQQARSLIDRPQPPRAEPKSAPDPNAEERMRLLRRLAQGTKEQVDASVQTAAFSPVQAPGTRVILRYVHEPPEEVFVVPDNECFHVYGKLLIMGDNAQDGIHHHGKTLP